MRILLALHAFMIIAAAPQSVDLSDADGMFEDIARNRETISADAVNSNCIACHSATMVTHQPALGPAQWQATLNKMRMIYKAPIDTGDDAAILAWLEAYSARQQAE